LADGLVFFKKEVNFMYQPNPKLEKLKAEREKAEREKTQWEHRGQRLENRIRYCTEGERKKRTHRLVTRGAAVESIVPQVREMGEVEFYSLAEKIFSIPAVMKIVNAHCLARDGGDAQ
jgi:hypothetical protein